MLRALPRDCLWCIPDYLPCAGNRKFMRQFSRSGHEAYSVVLATKMLQGDRPDLEEIKLILREAVTHGSDGAKYFELMLKVLAKDGFSMDEVLRVFRDLFNRKQLAECGRAIMNAEDPPSFSGYYWPRPLLPDLEYRFTCTSNGTCKGHGRRPNIFWPLPGTDDEYSMTNLYLFCRLDVEIAWFLIHFRFLEDARF